MAGEIIVTVVGNLTAEGQKPQVNAGFRGKIRAALKERANASQGLTIQVD